MHAVQLEFDKLEVKACKAKIHVAVHLV